MAGEKKNKMNANNGKSPKRNTNGKVPKMPNSNRKTSSTKKLFNSPSTFASSPNVEQLYRDMRTDYHCIKAEIFQLFSRLMVVGVDEAHLADLLLEEKALPKLMDILLEVTREQVEEIEVDGEATSKPAASLVLISDSTSV